MYVSEHRPWVTLNASIASDLTYTEGNEWQLSISGVVENIGSSPAAKVSFWVTFVPSLHPVGQAPEAQIAGVLDALCTQAIAATKRDVSFGALLFPKEKRGHHFTTQAPRERVEAAKAQGSGYLGQFRVLVCTAYATTFDDEVHVTARTFALYRNDGKRIDLTSGEPVPTAFLSMLEMPGGSHSSYAT